MISYLEKIKEELQLDYSYNFNNLFKLETNIALKMLLFDYCIVDQLDIYDEKAILRFKQVLNKIVNRSLHFVMDNFPQTNEYQMFKNYMYGLVDNIEQEKLTPNQLFEKCWPAPLSPNIFIDNYDSIPYPHYVYNAYDINGRWWRGFGRGRDPLFIVEFSLYVGCEINCTYCPQKSLYKASKSKFLTVNEYKDILDKIPSTVSVVFAGFIDPLLYQNLKEVVEYTRFKGHNMYIATTLPEKIKENIDIFLNKKYWNGRTVHLRDESMNYGKNSNYYYETLDNYFSQFNDKLRDNRFSFLGKVLDIKILELLKKYNLESYFRQITPYKRIDSTVKDITVVDNPKLKGNIYCTRGFYRKQMIAPDGDVVLCCMDVEKKHILGNLKENTFDEIYNNEEYKKVLKGFNDENLEIICRQCIYAKEL